MKQASNIYMRLMKTVTVWVMAMFLFAPITTIITPKTPTQNSGLEITPTVAQAAGCTVENAVFNPSSTGNSDTTNEARFYLGRDGDGNTPANQEKIIIKIRTSNCIGVPLQLKILGESDSEYAQFENNKNTGVNTVIGKSVEFTPIEQGGGLSTTALTINPGEDNCDANGNVDDCKLFIEIYKKDNSKDVKIYDTNDPERINQRGYLGYECTGTYCSNNHLFRLVSIDYNDTDPLVELWYFKTKEKGIYYIAEDAVDVESCKKVAETEYKDNNDIDISSCTNNPDYQKISSSNSIINQGKPVAQAAVGACFELQISLTLFFNPTNCLALILRDTIYPIIAFMVGLVGKMFDFVFSYAISADPYKNDFITVAWTFVRDLCNASFIFILLYIAIMTVLNKTSKADYKSILPKVIIVALIINFSLFIGRVIIDVGNVTARVLYNSDLVSLKNADGTPSSISASLIDSFDPQNLIKNGASNFNRVTQNGQDDGTISAVSIIIITLMSIVMLFVFAKILFELTFVFIGRIVGLWMQLILAPIAFIASAVPFLKIPAIAGGGGGFSWFSTTFKQSIQATVFAFFLYLTLIFAKLGIVTVKGTDVSSGIAFFLSIIIPFLIIYTLMETAKKQSISMATAIANTATDAIKGVAGTVAKVGLLAGGAAVAPVLARTVGGLASKASNSGMLKSLSGRAGSGSNFISKRFNNFVADTATKTSSGLNNLSKNKFDARENSLVKGAFKMAGFGDTKNLDLNIPGMPKNIVSDKLNSALRSAGETTRLKGLDAMAEEKKKQMEQRLANMKLTEDNIDKDKLKDDRKKMADWLRTRNNDMKAAKSAAIAAGTTFDEKAFTDSYAVVKPKLNYKGSVTTKDTKAIANIENKTIENRFARRMERDAKTPSLGQRAANLVGKGKQYEAKTNEWEKKGFIKPDPEKGAQKKFAKDIKKANEKRLKRKESIDNEISKISQQEEKAQKNIDKLTQNVDKLVTKLSSTHDKNLTAIGVGPNKSFKELLDEKLTSPAFITSTASFAPGSIGLTEARNKAVKKASEEFNEQFESMIAKKLNNRDLAKIDYDAVKNNPGDPNYVAYKKKYENAQKDYARMEAHINTVNRDIERVTKKTAEINTNQESKDKLGSKRRVKQKTLGTI